MSSVQHLTAEFVQISEKSYPHSSQSTWAVASVAI